MSIPSKKSIEVLSLPFLTKPITQSLLELALSHEMNHKLANLGDGVLRLVIREYFYLKKSTAEEIQREEKRYANNEYLSSIATKINLDRYIISSSGLMQNPYINEASTRTLEAIIGAIYHDISIEEARSFIKKLIIV